MATLSISFLAIQGTFDRPTRIREYAWTDFFFLDSPCTLPSCQYFLHFSAKGAAGHPFDLSIVLQKFRLQDFQSKRLNVKLDNVQLSKQL